MTPLSVALFAKTFLEPTHHAIAAVLERLPSVNYRVFAKRFQECEGYRLRNVTSRIPFTSTLPPSGSLDGCHLIHAVFDGDIALRASGIASSMNLPFIMSFHGGFDTKAKIEDPLYRDLTALAASKATVVTVVSKGDAARLLEIGVSRRVHIVPVPVDLSKVSRSKPIPGRLVAIGRLVEKKGFDLAIAALQYLPETYSLHVVGEGPCHGPWQKLANQLGVSARINWLGALSLRQCLDELASAWALVHPARKASDGNSEGVPQVILWAQAAGVPVVTTAVGDICEVVRHGVTGLVAEVLPSALAAQIVALGSASDRESMITSGRHQAALHSLEGTAETWASLYVEALQSKGRPSA
jgi:glycosyltransferase involved in cell wall biosynthesis